METLMYNIPHYKVKLVKDRMHKYPYERINDAYAAETVGLHLLKNLPHEEIVVVYVNGINKIIGTQTISMGGISGTAITPKDVFRGALACNASAFVMIHNHPSGDPTPSAEDVDMTRKILKASRMIGICFLDHIVVADGRSMSIKVSHPDIGW